jgi:PAS domain-containing protein
LEVAAQPIFDQIKTGLLDAVEQAVIATDVAGRVVYWNAFAERLYGWSASETVGRELGEMLVPQGIHALGAEIVDQVFVGLELVGRAHDSTPRWDDVSNPDNSISDLRRQQNLDRHRRHLV